MTRYLRKKIPGRRYLAITWQKTDTSGLRCTCTFSQEVIGRQCVSANWYNPFYKIHLAFSCTPRHHQHSNLNILGKRCLNFLKCAKIVSDTCRKYGRGQQTWPSFFRSYYTRLTLQPSLNKPCRKLSLLHTAEKGPPLHTGSLPVEVSSIRFQLDLAEGNDKPKPWWVSQLVPGPGKPILLLSLAH